MQETFSVKHFTTIFLGGNSLLALKGLFRVINHVILWLIITYIVHIIFDVFSIEVYKMQKKWRCAHTFDWSRMYRQLLSGKMSNKSKGFLEMFRLSQRVTEPENKSQAAEGENAAAVQIASSSVGHKARWSIIDRTLGGKCRFGGQAGQLFWDQHACGEQWQGCERLIYHKPYVEPTAGMQRRLWKQRLR